MKIGNEAYFEILRPGINTTTQDQGRYNYFHLGITVSGAIDQRNFKLSNLILNNKIDLPVLEFAFQGPLLKFKGDVIGICVTGNVVFDIIRKDQTIEQGLCYQVYIINGDDQIDLKSTKNSLYGYLAIKEGLNVEKVWDSYSINTKANIGPNNGEKFSTNQKIFINSNKNHNLKIRRLKYKNNVNSKIRVIRGTNFDYFTQEAQNNFFNKKFKITNLVDRMGIRLSGTKLENTFSTNIKSEGLVKGVIQVPADGNLIIMLADHGTIGGYPKIATVISADLDNLAQLPPNSEISFTEVNLEEAEQLYKKHLKELNKYISILNEFN
jgi:biotin-dependent carboxylase-like uncharacterized protein|tara:strand:+ start:291 stop:1262 length:972 start_codon:yes stop_codon:yes gene_type:complete